MTHELWLRVERIFQEAVQLPVAERAAYLDRACAGEADLRAEVARLLAAEDEARGFLEAPAVEVAARAMAAGEPLAPGNRLGPYEIVSLVGAGGMGQVYKARDTRLNRSVALKVLPLYAAGDAEQRKRLLREARAASALNHPHIVTLHDILSEDGGDALVMEYLDGHTLQEKIGREGLPLRTAVRYAIQIAAALEAAHAAGIVHRDVKPGNIMVTAEVPGPGTVKVLDFGLAKQYAGMGPHDETATISIEGLIAGTIAYMSPEQAEGKPIDARSDIFSFGSVLYEMVSGRQAFARTSRADTLSAILHDEPPALPGMPAELERLIARCLRKDPGGRFQNISEVKQALGEIGAEPGARMRPQTPSRSRWIWATAVPVLLAAGLLVWRAWRPQQPAALLKAVAMTTVPGVKSGPSFSPDGDYVVFTWNGPRQDNPDIYVQQIGTGGPFRRTTDPRNDFDPVWSPDGRSIAFLRETSPGRSEICLIAPLGGPERPLAEIRYGQLASPPFMAWCPDNGCLVVTDSPGEGKPDALFVVSPETGEKRQLTDPQLPTNGDNHPALSPDGRRLVFRRHRGVGIGELYWLGLGKGMTPEGKPQRITTVALRANYPTWTPDGREILFSASGGLWRVAVPGDSPPVRLPYVGEDGLMPVVSHPQAGKLPRLVYVRSYVDTNIWRIATSAPGGRASTQPEVAISSTRIELNPRLSPDGRRVAFDSDRSGASEVWLADPDGSNAAQLTSMGASSGFANWSNDGRMIAFHSNFGEMWQVYVIPATGSKPRPLTTPPAGGEGWPSFSRDGKWVYFSRKREVWKMPASGGEAVQVTHGGGLAALESVDGKYLYYTQDLPPRSPLWRMPTSGGEAVKLLDDVYDFVVIEPGIYYIDHQPDEARLEFLSFATGKSTLVASNLGKVARGLTASPDGRSIFYSRVDSSVDDLMLVENFR